ADRPLHEQEAVVEIGLALPLCEDLRLDCEDLFRRHGKAPWRTTSIINSARRAVRLPPARGAGPNEGLRLPPALRQPASPPRARTRRAPPRPRRYPTPPDAAGSSRW